MLKFVFAILILLIFQSCAPLVGLIGVASVGSASKEKGIGTSFSDTIKDNIKEKLSSFSLRDTVNMIVSETGLSKKVIYNEAIKINNENINTKK